jgi:hypothetical protein
LFRLVHSCHSFLNPTLQTVQYLIHLITNPNKQTINMRFFEIVVSGAALVSSAFAVTIDTYPTAGVEAGKSYTITYSPKDQPATFILRKGVSTDLDTVATIGMLFEAFRRFEP